MIDNLQRFSFDPAGRQIFVSVGKVEIGQHVHNAFQIIVAESLEIGAAHVKVSPVTTASSPDDGLTAGSLSMQITGTALRSAAIALRATLIRQAAQRFECDIDNIVRDSDTLEFCTHEERCSIFELPLAKNAPGSTIDNVAEVDTTISGSTISASIRGERMYIQDVTLPGMIYARAVRGRKINLDNTHAVKVVRNGGFAALVADTEIALDRAWSQLELVLPARDPSCDGPVESWIQTRHAKTQESGEASVGETSVVENPIFQIATRPFLLHASIAPSCAIARYKAGVLEIWTHSQGIFPLRETIASQVGFDIEQVVVRHIASAGSYGHNAADDAAMDAVLVSLHYEGTPVRVAWTRQDEFQHAPVGAPMLVQVETALNDDNSIGSWHQTVWSGPHGQRPGAGEM